mgnify:CR=1 FL=1
MNMTYSIIIPVLNESEIINQSIKNILKVNNGYEIEIIVVDGDMNGNTVNAIENKNVIKIIAGRGRGKQMNAGAFAARGDVLIFLHADTEFLEGAFELINLLIVKKMCDCGSFSLGIKSNKVIFRLIEKMVYLRTKLTNIPYGDQAFFIKRDKFFQLGGFADIPIMEDIEFMRRAKKSGLKLCILPQKVLTSARRWNEEGIIYNTVRNWILATLYFTGVKPEKLERFYYKH